MHPNERALRDSYAAFNSGDLELAAGILANDVEWPDQLEGTMLVGRDATIAYWKRLLGLQRHEYEVVHCQPDQHGDLVISLLRKVYALNGQLISNGLIRHVYRFRCGKVVRMQVVV